MKIIHFSDPHAGGGAETWRAYFDKRWVGVFNYRFLADDAQTILIFVLAPGAFIALGYLIAIVNRLKKTK